MDFVGVVLPIIIFGGGASLIIAAVLSAIVMSKVWSESPAPIKDYREWKRARAIREDADSNNFEYYKELCEEERKYARWTLHSFFWLATVVFAPVSVVGYILFAVLYYPFKFVRILWSLPKVIQSAKGI